MGDFVFVQVISQRHAFMIEGGKGAFDEPD
jgi:hypothetical protein